MSIHTRDYTLAERVSRLSDQTLIGVEEAAALTGFAAVSIQQRRVSGFPQPLPGLRILKFRLGEVRAWMGVSDTTLPPQRTSQKKHSGGRKRLPTDITSVLGS